uniref:Mitochondrial arginine transporter BAC1 isoform X1 n=1 Tax=Tanacetum cinerariifolium TaxID=118510 RepID=A0A6L2JDJ6_TANCI|nr:mitochondrial arginine transporter BAC1 isoform X1 [Tanacetum cinerariifolium]
MSHVKKAQVIRIGPQGAPPNRARMKDPNLHEPSQRKSSKWSCFDETSMKARRKAKAQQAYLSSKQCKNSLYMKFFRTSWMSLMLHSSPIPSQLKLVFRHAMNRHWFLVEFDRVEAADPSNWFDPETKLRCENKYEDGAKYAINMSKREMGDNYSSSGSGWKHYVAGLVSGVSMVIAGHPFDTVKVKLQKHNTEASGFKYRNGLHCATRILKTEGVRGLYRGATPSFLGMAFESSLVFGIYSQTKQALQGVDLNRKPAPHIIIPSAAFAGSIISFILCPSELVKCRMQIQGTDSVVPSYRKYSGPLNCAIETIKTDGVTGLFRGGVATLLRESIGNAVFFSTYEYLRHSLHSQFKGTSFDHTNMTDVGIGIVSGGLGGIACWSVVLPLDVAKTIIQTSPDKNLSKNPIKLLKSIYRRAGLKGCYAGLGPTISRAFPANAAAIVTFETAAKALGIGRMIHIILARELVLVGPGNNAATGVSNIFTKGPGSAWKAYINARVAGLFLLVLLEYPNGKGVDETSEPLLYAGWMAGPYRCKDATRGRNDDPVTSGIKAGRFETMRVNSPRREA